MAVAVDTNIVVRHLMRDDDAQVAVAEAFVKGGAWISHVVLVDAVWELRTVHRLELRFADCLILEIARTAGHLPLGTFDKALARLDDTQRLS